MAKKDFHNKAYDPGTITKLKIFEAYVQAWLPVFLSKPNPSFDSVHVFDFFSGPGTDSADNLGSPLRILKQLQIYKEHGLSGWPLVKKHVHFSDLDAIKVGQLAETIASYQATLPELSIEMKAESFEQALTRNQDVLLNRKFAKLLIIDQFGVDAVSDDVFRFLVNCPTTDFIFFLSSSTLHRFRNHDAIKQKIPELEDSYHVHRAAYQYFRDLLPKGRETYLGQFSIKKGANTYGLIFGSQHPLGIHKFLEVAWKNDRIRGEANFDVDRDNIGQDELLLALDEFKPKKLNRFETELEKAFDNRCFAHEFDILKFCIENGMTNQHAKSTILKLKKAGRIACEFSAPNIRNLKAPRPIRYF